MKILRKIQIKLEVLQSEVAFRAQRALNYEYNTARGTFKFIFYASSWYLLWIPILFVGLINGEKEEEK